MYYCCILQSTLYSNKELSGFKLSSPVIPLQWPLCLVSIDLAPRSHIHLFTLLTTITASSLRSRMASLVASRNVTLWALYYIFMALYYLLGIKIQHLLSCGLPYIMYILLILVIILHLPTVVEKQGKFGGFDSCYWPSNLTQIGFNSSVNQPVWPWNLMNNLEKH